jgi:hypothetical protein
VEASAAARLHRLPDAIVGVGIPAFRIVEDADAGVAVGADVDEAADLLGPPCRIARQEAGFGMGEAEVDQDRRALGEDAAVVEDQRRDLRDGIDALELVETGRRLPRRGVDSA